ncbi:TIGR02300 family protein [Parasphingorhabdus sp. JC815]|uniref:TIGR02300 family protein n=1 Tax=Parasphingorhabdus sp. JC815 TaxID=3232140 RepID=UPI003457E259
MVKPEWGTKRTCPKCGTRFYDLGKEDPVACIECEETWIPEPGLKSKQPMPFEESPKKDAKKEDEVADDDLDINIDDDDPSPDNEVDLGGDDDLGVTKGKGDDEDNAET